MSGVSGVRAAPSPSAGGGLQRRGEAFGLLPESVVAGTATAVMEVVSPAGLSGALALQELGCEAPQDRAARRRGYDLLASLRALQRDLLASRVDAGSLADLAALSAAAPEAADPRLREVIAELVLRARVELARHGL
jgi:hypothetical protein